MKTNKNTNSMYALLLAAAVMVGGSIWFACSADDEFESNYEMETLAKGEMSLSIEPGENDDYFMGVYLTHNIATFENENIMGDWTANHFTVEWSDGYTGNLCADSLRCVTWISNIECNTDDFTLEYPYVFLQNCYNLTTTCRWNRQNEFVLTYKFYYTRFYWDGLNRQYKYNNPVIGNDSVTHKYTMSSVMERCLNTYEDSIPE